MISRSPYQTTNIRILMQFPPWSITVGLSLRSKGRVEGLLMLFYTRCIRDLVKVSLVFK